MKASALFWLGKKQIFRNMRSTRAALAALFVSSMFFSLSWMVYLSLSSYNEQFADSTGAYDFELNGSSVPPSDEQFTLMSVSSSSAGQVEGREARIQYCSKPDVLYPRLLEGSYPKENEVLLTYPAAALFDLSPGDLVEISMSDDEAVSRRVSGIVQNNFTRCVMVQDDGFEQGLVSGWYEVNKGVPLDQVQKTYPNAIINYQRQNYKHTDRTNRIEATRSLLGISAAFLFCALLAFDLIWIQKERQNERRLRRSGASRRDGMILNCGILLGLQAAILPVGYAIAAAVWFLSLLILKQMSAFNPFSTIPSVLPFSLPIAELARSVLLMASLAILSLFAGILISQIKTRRKNRTRSARETLTIPAVLRKPLKRNPAVWLIFLFVLVCCSGSLNLAWIAANTPFPAANEKTGATVDGSITFPDPRAVAAFFQQAEAQLPECQITVRVQGSALDHKPVFAMPGDGGTASSSGSVLLVVSEQEFARLFGDDLNMPVHLAEGKNEISAPAWFMIGDISGSGYLSLDDVVEARKAMIVETLAWNLDPKQNEMESIMNGQEDVWVLNPSLLQTLQTLPQPVITYLEVFSAMETGPSLAKPTLQLFRQWNASSYSYVNSMDTVNNMRHMAVVLIGCCLFELLLILFTGSILMRQLLALLFQSQKQDLVHLNRAGLSKKRASSVISRMFSVFLLTGSAGSLFLPLFLQRFVTIGTVRGTGLLLGAWILFVLVFLIAGLTKIQWLFAHLAQTDDEI